MDTEWQELKDIVLNRTEAFTSVSPGSSTNDHWEMLIYGTYILNDFLWLSYGKTSSWRNYKLGGCCPSQ
jgi:hypothetical protein